MRGTEKHDDTCNRSKSRRSSARSRMMPGATADFTTVDLLTGMVTASQNLAGVTLGMWSFGDTNTSTAGCDRDNFSYERVLHVQAF